MATDVDTSLRGTTELRIHGVSGTPPEVMLQHPHVKLVAGDARAGFYRRWFPARDTLDVPNRSHREAYSWGALTSGGASRALWLLLLPFAFVNVASWTEPGPPDQAVSLRRPLEGMLRLFALSLTGTLVLAMAAVSMDLLAWQCAVPDSRCAEQHSVAGWLTSVDTPGRRLALAALLPAAGIAVLWFLGRRTWGNYESTRMPADDEGSAHDFSLSDPRFWEGQLPVQRLRALHITASWALLALLLAEPARRHADAVGSAWLSASSAVVFLSTGTVLACAVMVLVPQVADRCDPAEGPSQRVRRLERVWRLLPWFGVVLLVSAAVVAWGPRPTWESSDALPLINTFLLGGFLAQFGLLAALVAVNRKLPRHPQPIVPIAVWGQALPMFAALGWLLAGAFAAGGAVRVAEWLGTPVADGDSQRAELARIAALEASPSLADRIRAVQAPEPLLVPPLFTWVALIAAVLLIGVLFVLVPVVAYRFSHLRRESVASVRAGHPAADTGRARAVGRALALAKMSDAAPRYLAILVAAVLLLVVAGVVGYAVDRSWPQRALPALTNVGSWVIGALALLLVALGRAAYRTPQMRRTVGILWDLASFWPRAAHPLAPPCYCERVLPDLVYRAEALTEQDDDRLLLSAHSQGSVIALAAVLQLPSRTAQRAALLTYGSPLTRLYAAFFPGYVSREAYAAAAARLGGAGASTAGWPWRNLYRLTDPIGGWVLCSHDGGTAVDDVDCLLEDPVFDRSPGDPAWPPTRGHLDYWADPGFDATRERVLQLRG